mgnify:FL=1
MATSQFKHQGLDERQVAESRAKHGNNLLTPPPRTPMWKLYLEKFKDPIIRVLLVAAVFSLIISFIESEFAESIGIIVAIFLATGIGFYFEYDAGKKFDLLNATNEETLVRVIRGGSVHEVPRKDIVVGDIVMLENGEEIPADGELLEATSMQVNESSLTGEPMVEKTTDPAHFDKEATYPSNHVMRGTTVVDGHGIMQVLHVGDATEIGKVARQATEESSEKTPLNIQLERLADLIGKVGFIVAALAFIGFTWHELHNYLAAHTVSGMTEYLDIAKIVLHNFMMAVTLIVVTVPEGLPMSVTLSLALNMRRMLATNNLVRKMHACETMGAVTVICTDKTGTLTQNRMQVHETKFEALNEQKLDMGQTNSQLVAEGIAANSTAYLEEEEGQVKGVGNPTEIALLLWMQAQGQDYLALRNGATVVNQLPFSTERKFMATLVESAYATGKRILYLKGAPEIISKKCALIATPAGTSPMSDAQANIDAQLLTYQNMAMRTLGFAYRVVGADEPADCAQLTTENNFTFLGVVAISDPIRPDVPAAVQQCQDAGIRVKIVTGDTPGTATEIARQIGLWKPEDTERNRITGTDFAALSDEEALARVMDLKIMSRARPTDKQRLVQLLQKKGAVVAVTGDGTNDAPALNHAQVGLSMGTGTSVAKEASDITLLDDSFRSIGTAVMWGRSLYKNIQRFIAFQLTINLIAMFIVLAGSFMGDVIPLTVTQMLWVNLIMDTFAALALASIPPSADVMKEQPRKQSDFIINRGMYHKIFGTGIAFILILLGLYYWLGLDGDMSVRDLTIFFTVFVLLQFWNLFNARVFGTTHSALGHLAKSYVLVGVAAVILIGQYIIVQFGGDVFRTTPLDWQTWLILLACTSPVLWIGELLRLFQKLRK